MAQKGEYKYTEEELAEIAKRYNTISEFIKNEKLLEDVQKAVVNNVKA